MVARLLLVVARNAHAARADGVTHQGIFPHVAMINHSCLPNAWWVKVRVRLWVRFKVRVEVRVGIGVRVVGSGCYGQGISKRCSLERRDELALRIERAEHVRPASQTVTDMKETDL